MPNNTDDREMNSAGAAGGGVRAERVYESEPSEPDDNFWIEQGRKMLTESLTAVRDAAKSLMTGLGALQGLYLTILGFAKFVPPEASIPVKVLFMAPLLFWMIALYNCLQVMMTRTFDINLNSPTEIRDHAIARVKNKQRFLTWAFAFLVAGLVAAMLLVILAWQYETLLSPTR